MPETKETQLDAFKVQLSSLTLDNAKLQKENQELKDQINRQNITLEKFNTIYEADSKAKEMMQILAGSTYSQSDLEPLSVEQLQQINKVLSKNRTAGTPTFKPITMGDQNDDRGKLTVGSLYGLSRKEILDKGGNF